MIHPRRTEPQARDELVITFASDGRRSSVRSRFVPAKDARTSNVVQAHSVQDSPRSSPAFRRQQLQAGRTRSTSTSTPATRRSTATPSSSTRSSCPARAHWRSPASTSPTSRRAGRWRSTSRPDGRRSRTAPKRRDARQMAGRTCRFAETQPLPTYLFAFAAGRFSVETAERDGRTFRMFHRETDAAKVARNREAIFDLHARRSTGSKATPASRIHSASSTSCSCRRFSSAAWSTPAPSSTTPSGLMLDETATQNQLLERASLIAHETAHMWFGDLVTMRWFNDVWMKEVFANFMAAKIVNPSFPAIDHELRFLLAHYPSAYESIARRAPTPSGSRSTTSRRPAGCTARSSTRRRRSSCGSSRGSSGETASATGCGSTWRASLRQRDVGRSDRDSRRADGRGPRRVEPRLGRRSRAPDRHDRAARRQRRHRGLPFSSATRSRSRPRLESATAGRARPADGSARCRCAWRTARVDVPGPRGLPAPRFVLPNGGGLGYGVFAARCRQPDVSPGALPTITTR